MKAETKALHTRIDIDGSDPVVTPIFQASAFQSTSPYFYTRNNNPNIAELEEVVRTLESTNFAIATTTGMSAITLVLSLLKHGETLVINKDIYGCSYKLMQQFTERIGVKLIISDLSIEENIDRLEKVDMVLFETPTNPFLKTIPISYVAEKVKANNKNALVVVDNTWASPLFQHPCEIGADISLHSATKYFSGHSDIMGGVILMDDEKLHQKVKDLRFYYGAILAPQSAWLLRRSLQTFGIRMRAHQKTTLVMRDFLETIPEIEKVYYPKLDEKQLNGYATLLFFDLKKDRVKHYPEFAKNLELFVTGTGMACVTSMIAQPYTGSHASMNSEEKESMGLKDSLIRLSFGLEDVEDLKNDLEKGFESLRKF